MIYHFLIFFKGLILGHLLDIKPQDKLVHIEGGQGHLITRKGQGLLVLLEIQTRQLDLQRNQRKRRGQGQNLGI